MKHFLSAFLAAVLCPIVALGQVSLGNDTSTFGRTIYVHATGSDSENGAALVAALGSATVIDRSDPGTERVLIDLGPGIFNIEDFAPILMPDFVDLRGSGAGTTIVENDSMSNPGIFNCIGTANQFSHLYVSSSTYAISASDAARVTIDHASLNAEVTLSARGLSTYMSIFNSSVGGFADAISIADGANVSVEHSRIIASDFAGNGAITGSNFGGDPILNVSYSFISTGGSDPGNGGIENPWPGGKAYCAYITTRPTMALVEVNGCPLAGAVNVVGSPHDE